MNFPTIAMSYLTLAQLSMIVKNCTILRGCTLQIIAYIEIYILFKPTSVAFLIIAAGDSHKMRITY